MDVEVSYVLETLHTRKVKQEVDCGELTDAAGLQSSCEKETEAVRPGNLKQDVEQLRTFPPEK